MPVNLSVDDRGVATVTLARAAKRNALDEEMLTSLASRVASVAADAAVRAVVVRGEGGNFCAGADISEWVSPTGPEATRLSALGRDVFGALAGLRVPSVAVIEGSAVGGGLELALACDVRVAEPSALIGFPELRLGNLPAWGGLARLVGIVGLGVTRDLLLTGTLIDGEKAGALGVVSRISEPGGVEAAVGAVVDGFVACDPTALTLAKQVLSGFDRDLPLEPVMAAHTAGLEGSRARKQAFLDRKAALRSR